MDKKKRELEGSPSRDKFKRKHKEWCRHCYATDIDFALVSKRPAGIVAFIDYQQLGERASFAEVLAYNTLLEIAPIYLVRGHDAEEGPFEVVRYLGGNWKPEPPEVTLQTLGQCGWEQFMEWEQEMRREYQRQGGWGKPPDDWFGRDIGI